MVRANASFALKADAQLRQQVLCHLLDRQMPALRRLIVHVSGGVVTLGGEVRSYYEQQLVLHCCRQFADKATVVNRVRVIG